MPTALESACDLNHNDSMTVTDEPTDLIDTSDAPEPRFVDDRLAHWAATTPDAECFSYLGRSWTYAQTDDRVRRLAGALHGLGVRRGGTVAFLDKNHPACVELSLAAGSLGAANAIINFRLAGDEIDYAVNDSGATVLLVGTELMPVIEAIRDRLTHVEHRGRADGPARRGLTRGHLSGDVLLRHHRSSQGRDAQPRQHGRPHPERP